jgi:hypothetical protein
MIDRNGNKLDIGSIVRIINQTNIPFDVEGWIVSDFIEVGIFTHIFLKHCITHEIRIFDSKDIERTY